MLLVVGILLAVLFVDNSHSFVVTRPRLNAIQRRRCSSHSGSAAASSLRKQGLCSSLFSTNDTEGAWDGSVVTSNQGKIQGCTLEQNGDTVWTLKIDGVEADLGQFSLAIYKKITMDAKKQRFQGFRPGTIPPHLEPTYRAFTMDECARETVLEAMQQNNIRPFENCRSEMELYDFSIPPASTPKKKKGGRKAKKKTDNISDESEEKEPEWRFFNTMKEAIDAGWKPGQSFSFCATDVRGQLLQQDDRGRTVNPLTGKKY